MSTLVMVLRTVFLLAFAGPCCWASAGGTEHPRHEHVTVVPAERLEDLRRRLTPGGRIAIASHPRCPGATSNISLDAASEITDLLQAAGFTQTRTDILDSTRSPSGRA